MAASPRETIFATQCPSSSLFIFGFLGEEEFVKPGFETFRIEVSLDDASMTNRNDARLLADDDDDGIKLLGEAEPGAMAQAEIAIEIDALSHGPDRGRRENAVAPHDDTAVVQGGLRMEDRDQQLLGEI